MSTSRCIQKCLAATRDSTGFPVTHHIDLESIVPMSILRVKSEWYWQDNYISYISVLNLTMKLGTAIVFMDLFTFLPCRNHLSTPPHVSVPQLVTCCDPIPNMEPKEKMTFSKNPTESFGACLKYPTGWWYTNPSEKWWSSSVGMMKFPIHGKS